MRRDAEFYRHNRAPYQRMGLVCVRPGVYRETLRLTRNVFLMGYGGKQMEIVVEAPGRDWDELCLIPGSGASSILSPPKTFLVSLGFRLLVTAPSICRAANPGIYCSYSFLGCGA